MSYYRGQSSIIDFFNETRIPTDGCSQTEFLASMAPKPKRNRNRNRRNRSRNRQRNRNVSITSTYESQFDPQYEHFSDHRNEPMHRHLRPRTESNVSVGVLSGISGMTGSGRESDGQRGGQIRQQKNNRWDRERLSREIWSYYIEHSQSGDLLTRKNRLRDALHKILTSNFPNYEVDLFIVGSTANGLASNKSDVDICLVLNEIDKKTKESTSAEDEKDLTIIDKLMASPNRKEVVKETVESIDAQETKVGIIVNYDGSDPVVDNLNISTLSATNGAVDPSIPMLEMVYKVLLSYNFVTKMQIIMAKVPILKFVDRISEIEVTLNVNKLVSIRNTHLIHDYTKLDWRLQPLAMIIKAWASDHDINNAYNKSISSYSLVLMVIHYLQYVCSPPVLPCLQQLDPEQYSPDRDINLINLKNKVRRWRSTNHLSLKELFIGFLDYYSYTFCYAKDAISVRLGQTIPKHVVQRYKSEENQFSHWKYLCIEEPFNRTNTARSVYDEMTFDRILSAFRVSHYTLRRYPFLDSIMTGKQYSKAYSTPTDPYVSDY